MHKILIADDASDLLSLFASLFEDSGFKVTTASNGEEALLLAKRDPPDLVISDVLMPRMDGFELCRRFRQDEVLKDIPFILFTVTFVDARDEHLAMSLGADRFLIKPSNPAKLLAAAREILTEKSPGRLQQVTDESQLLQDHKEALARKLHEKIDALRDESEQRGMAQAALGEQSSLLGIAMRMGRLGGWKVDLDEMRVHWSDEVARIHEMPESYSPTVEEAIEFYAPECRERMTEVFDRCARKGDPYDEEMEIETASGLRRWVRTIGEAIRNDSGRIKGVQGAFQDITEQKRAQEEHAQLLEQFLASQKMEAIGRLAGGVAHDFNNMLAVILNCAEFAIEELGDDNPVLEDLEEIREAGRRAADLTRQLLAFSRKQMLEPSPISLNELVTGLDKMLGRLLGEDIEIETRLSDDLGMALADPGQLEQVLVNLAINARDAMEQGGRLVIETSRQDEIDVDKTEEGGMGKVGPFVVLSVTDTGCGMDTSTLGRIFEPFFTTKETGKGTGLGLSTVHGIVKQSGGEITVQSRPGCGTSVKVFLPAIQEEQNDAKATSKPEACRGDARILVVEDEDSVRRLAERILKKAGYQVVSAASAAEARELFNEEDGRFDLLLTDVVMPRTSGPELADELTKLRPELEVLFMSGYAGDAISQHGIMESGAHFISKPFTGGDLSEKVRAILDERRNAAAASA